MTEQGDWIATGSLALVGAERGWSGPASAAYARHVRPLGANLAGTALATRVVAAAVERYADSLAALQRRADDLVDVHWGVSDAARALAHRAASILVGAAAAELIAALAPEQAQLRARIRSLTADVEALARETTGAEDALVLALRTYRGRAALTRQGLGGPDALVAAALVGAGVASAAGLAALSPNDAASWWNRLTVAERSALLAQFPAVLGGLDGVPAGARDTANRTLLRRDIAALEARRAAGSLTPGEASALANAQAVREQIEVIETSDDLVSLEPIVAQLYDYQPYAFGGDGKALLSVGDLDSADNVAVNVPGLTTTVRDSLEGNVENSLNLYEEARWADRSETMASLVWIGYDAPSDSAGDFATVAGESRAQAGGGLLAQDVDGFLASRGEDSPHLTVIGHSYGSTTTAVGAAQNGFDADDIVLIGSPGAGNGTDEATDLGIGADHVWVGSASTDYVTYLGSNGWLNAEELPGTMLLGNDPAEDSFGAQRFQAEVVGRTEWANISDHTQYYRKDSESLANIAAIVTDRDDEVVHADARTDPWWRSSDEPEEDRAPTRRSFAP